MGAIKHTFQSVIADDPVAEAAGEVTPGRWNADHDLSTLTPNDIPGLSASLSTGAASVTSLSTSTSTAVSSLSTSCSTGLSTATSSIVSLSTSASTGLSTATSGIVSLSTGLSTTNSTAVVLSTSASTGLSTATSSITSLSTSTSTGISSLSTSTSTAIAGVTAGSGTKTYANLTPLDNQPPASNFATLDTRNSVICLDFDDTTAEGAIFVGVMPEAASLASGLIVYLHWAATTATTGNVIWEASFARLNAANQDLDSYAFDTITASAASAADGTSGKLTKTTITVAAADTDAVAAGDMFALKVRRLPADGSDTMAGDAELYAVELRSGA